MVAPELTMACIGGPTALLKWGSLRILADPTFDPAGEEYAPRPCTLRKTAGAAIVPPHYDGWAHDTESREDIAGAFARAGLADRLLWGEPEREIVVAPPRARAAEFPARKAI